jgi:hypothetical protein
MKTEPTSAFLPIWGIMVAIIGMALFEDEPSINPDPLPIPFGPPAAIDGEVSPDEWATANLVTFSFEDVFGDSVSARVWLMHDGGSLQAAYAFERTNEEIFLAPELFLDTDNDKNSTLRSDDWWFHVSGSDCAAAGRYDDYSTCTWNADWETGPRPYEREEGKRLDTFEIRIPFPKLGVVTGITGQPSHVGDSPIAS